MELDIVKALLIIYHYCLDQDGCSSCSLRDLCMKAPSDWA